MELRGTNKPEEWSVAPPNVTVTVEGRPSLMESFDPERAGLKIYADLSNIFMTPVVLPLKTEIRSSDMFSIVKVEPQNITLNK